jgi:two-component system response regulator VicR
MPKKILVVEDDPDILEILTYVFKGQGYDVVASDDGSACRHLPDILPDLIIMDVRLKEPGQNGDEICVQLKSQPATRGFPVILLSAENDLQARSQTCGADGFISKPFDLEMLTQKVRETIR